MTKDYRGFELTVTLPAAELAVLKRRIVYLEATLVQVFRQRRTIKEWFTAAELAGMRLPGIPLAKGAVSRLARREGWMTREANSCNEYHFSTLPRRAFETLIDRVIAPAVAADDQALLPAFAPPPAPPPALPRDAAPPWLLPLMRVIRSEAPATVKEALDLLPRYLPGGVTIPTADEVLPELQRLGMLR